MNDTAHRRTPWGLAILAMIIVACLNGLTTTGITAFDEAILAELGGGRADLKFREAINFWGAALLLPLTGWLIDKGGARLTSMAGLAILAAALFAYGQADSFWHLYSLHGAFALAIGLSGSLAMIVLVSRLFSHQRGLAVGIALAGTSFGGIVMGQVAPRLLEALGWRESFAWLAIVPLVLLVIVWLLVPRAGTSEATISAADKAASLPLSAAMRSRSFWLLAFAGLLTFGSILAVFQNIFLHMRDLGFTPVQAGQGISLLSACALAAKIAGGWLGDRYGAARLLKVNLVIMAAGAIGLASLDAGLVWLSLALIGGGWGGINTLINYLTLQVFGVGAAGRINGVISLFESIGAGAGPLAAALVFDATQSYAAAFLAIVAALAAAFIAIWFVQLMPAGPVRSGDRP